MSITNNIYLLRKRIPTTVNLVCVTKFHSEEAIMEVYEAGERNFGESKVQELMSKYEHLPKDIKWHFIGHLQANKIKYIIEFIELIHGVDSIKLLAAINKQALKINRIVDCLLQVHIAEEETKFGFSSEDINELDFTQMGKQYPNIRICGVMGMASYSDNQEQVRSEFKTLRNIFDSLQKNYFEFQSSFKIISMGMSNDFELAIKEGSTMLRIGSSIFGDRA